MAVEDRELVPLEFVFEYAKEAHDSVEDLLCDLGDLKKCISSCDDYIPNIGALGEVIGHHLDNLRELKKFLSPRDKCVSIFDWIELEEEDK